MKAVTVFLCCQFVAVAVSLEGASFENLGFDLADPDRVSSGSVQDLLPGWTLRSNTNTLQHMAFNVFAPDWPAILGDAVLVPSTNKNYPVFGEYSLKLTPVRFQEMSLSQSGAVPTDANSIRFIAFDDNLSGVAPANFFTVKIDDTSVPLLWRPFWEQQWPSLFAWSVVGDVSPFAGSNVDLTISTQFQATGPIPFPLLNYGIDNIEFSPLAAPEPGTVRLFALASGAMLFARWRRRERVRL